jgi:ABC-2 type transport system ATP-binding protein
MIVHSEPKIVDGAGAIEATDLRKTYAGGIEAVRGISFDVAPGEAFGLLGPNGAGKSTTVGMLTTTIRPTAGSARLSGVDVTRDPRRARAVASVVFQEAVVDRSLTGRQAIALHARLWGVRDDAAASRIDELADLLGVRDVLDRPVGTCSGGQRRRLEIARALVSRPRILFLDEPSVGLDPRIRAELLDVIAGLRARAATTILLTSHYLEEAERLCDRVAVIHEGVIVAQGAPAELRGALGRELVELRVDGDGEAALGVLRAHGVAGDDAFSIGATVTLPLHDADAGGAVAAIGRLGLPVTALATRPPTLDDVYLRLTGGRLVAAA